MIPESRFLRSPFFRQCLQRRPAFLAAILEVAQKLILCVHTIGRSTLWIEFAERDRFGRGEAVGRFRYVIIEEKKRVVGHVPVLMKTRLIAPDLFRAFGNRLFECLDGCAELLPEHFFPICIHRARTIPVGTLTVNHIPVGGAKASGWEDGADRKVCSPRDLV